MKITINNNNNSDSRETAIVEINTKHCHYPYSIRESLELALKLDGYSQETISKVFNQENEDAKKIIGEFIKAKPNQSIFQSSGTSHLPINNDTITATNECVVSKKKQSSIESIKEKLKIYLPDTLWDNDYLQDMLQRHEAKHKVEIMNAWHDAGGECSNSEIYYSETFGGGKDE